MTSVDVQHILIAGLSKYLGCPVVLSEQVQPELKFPYVICTPIAGYITTGSLGDHHKEIVPSEDGESVDILDTRKEMPEATFSFTACSMNEWRGDTYVLGDDEAQIFADRAQGWFLHTGYNELSIAGVVVVDITNAANRTAIVVDEVASQYGFDVSIRYTRLDTRRDATIDSVAILRD